MDLRDFQCVKKILDEITLAKSLKPLTNSLNYYLSKAKETKPADKERVKSAIPMNFSK